MTGDLLAAGVVFINTVILVLGGLITYFSLRAYRQTRAKPIGALAVGFGLITLGALLAGVASQAFDIEMELVLFLDGVFTAAGFGVITFSLYTDW